MFFSYYMPTNFIFGQGSIEKLHKQQLPGKKALIVISAGGSMRKTGYLDKLTAQLEKAGASWVLFDKIQPNPILDHVNEGAELGMNEKCDFVIGLGGGSSIDTAKAIAVKMANPDTDFWTYMGGSTGGAEVPPNGMLPVVAVTTTAGTGTEADQWMVITKTETKEKAGGGCAKTFPTLSVIDPLLMLSVPPDLTAYQGFDAFFHSTECYININANPISDLFCLDAISNIGDYLPNAVADGSDVQAREKVALANTEAGFTQSISGCISEHAMEHALSAYSPALPHGAGLISISLAYYESLIRKGACPERFVAMAKAMGRFDASEPEDFLKSLACLQKACNVDDIKLSEFGVLESDIKAIAKNAHDVMGGLFEVDPARLEYDDTLAIMKKSYR